MEKCGRRNAGKFLRGSERRDSNDFKHSSRVAALEIYRLMLFPQSPLSPARNHFLASRPESRAPAWLYLSTNYPYACRMRMWPRCVASQIFAPHPRNDHLVHYKNYGVLANLT